MSEVIGVVDGGDCPKCKKHLTARVVEEEPLTFEFYCKNCGYKVPGKLVTGGSVCGAPL